MPRERCFPTICSSFVLLILTVSATLRLFILNKAKVAFKYELSKIYLVPQEAHY